MKKIFSILALGGILTAGTVAEAQNTNSGYFLDGYTYRYQLNPAFGGTRNFVSFPGLGNINSGINGNLGVSDVLYKRDGRTVLFTNPMVSTDEVLGNFPDKAKFNVNAKINVISFGFKAFGGYNAFSLNARVNSHIGLPKSLITLAKEGVNNSTYDLKDLRANASGFAEIALTHSRDIKQVPGLRAGITLKGLIGVAHLDARFNSAKLTLNDNNWHAETDAELYASMPKFQFETKLNKENQKYVSGANLDGDGSFGPNGFGMAVDLGASYRWRDFTFSAAVLDLGWISYKDTHYATTHGVRAVNTDAFTFNVDGDAPNSFSDELDRLADNLEELYQLSDEGNIGKHNGSLGATLNVGAEYSLPVYRAVSFGLLSSSYFMGDYSWTEARLSVNFEPCKFFGLTANGAVGTYGAQFGWLLSLHPRFFNFFIGMDALPTKFAKQGVPLSSNCRFNLGINIPF